MYTIYSVDPGRGRKTKRASAPWLVRTRTRTTRRQKKERNQEKTRTKEKASLSGPKYTKKTGKHSFAASRMQSSRGTAFVNSPGAQNRLLQPPKGQTHQSHILLPPQPYPPRQSK